MKSKDVALPYFTQNFGNPFTGKFYIQLQNQIFKREVFKIKQA